MDFEQLMAQAQELQGKVAAAQEELGRTHVKGIAGAGDCIVELTGKYDVVNLIISDALVARGSAAVTETVIAAMRDAKEKADALIDKVMGDATAGMPMPE